MTKQVKHWLKFGFRWGVAVIGVTVVVRQIAFHDRVMLVNPDAKTPAERIMHVRVVDGTREEAATYALVEPIGERLEVSRDAVWTPGPTKLEIVDASGKTGKAKVLAVHPDPADPKRRPDLLLVEDAKTSGAIVVPAARVAGGFGKDYTPYPLVEVGLIRMVKQADPKFLLAALLVIPLTYLITSYRWHLLLESLDIHIGLAKTFTINMVGCFYNTFMPGSTGGDLVKAWYASRHTTHRTRAVISVLTDRAVGLLALIMLGGAMASFQWSVPACQKVALASAAMTGVAVAGMVVFYTPALRRLTGFDYVARRLPMQRTVASAIEAMEMFGRRPAASLFSLAVSFPVHISLIVSATFVGHALGISLALPYYWVMVPVICLVGAIPVSPQGAGVMEYFAVLLTRGQGVTVSQAFALVMAIRLVQIFWNTVAGLFVLRGGYHAPNAAEAHELEVDEPEATAPISEPPQAVGAQA